MKIVAASSWERLPTALAYLHQRVHGQRRVAELGDDSSGRAVLGRVKSAGDGRVRWLAPDGQHLGAEEHEADPEQVCREQMYELHPYGSQQDHIEAAEDTLVENAPRPPRLILRPRSRPPRSGVLSAASNRRCAAMTGSTPPITWGGRAASPIPD
jgi:hypothetical protein